MGKVREEGNCVTAKSTGSSGVKQVVMSLRCQEEEFLFDPSVHGEVSLEQ